MRGFLHCGKKMSIVQETVRCRAHCLFILIKKICVPCGNAGTDRLDFFHRSRKKGKKQALSFCTLRYIIHETDSQGFREVEMA